MSTTNRPIRVCRRAPHRARGAFSIVELLVVASILVLLLALSAGAIGNLLSSNARTQAANQLRVGLNAARDLAIRSDGGDAAALFTFENGRMFIVPVVQVGIVRGDANIGVDATTLAGTADREVFVPSGEVEPIAMPLGWTVRAYAAPGTIRDGWYSDTTQAAFDVASAPNAGGTWVFPETWYYDDEGDTTGREGWKRQSFIVRFARGTGELRTSDVASVLVFSPSPTDAFRASGSFASLPFADDLSNQESYVRAALQRDQATASAVLGAVSSDSILCRPVTMLSLQQEAELATAIGASRVDPVSRSLYVWSNAAVAGQRPRSPAINLPRLFPAGTTLDQVQERTNAFIMPDPAAPGGGVPNPGEFNARIFTLSRYQGQLQEFNP